MFVDVHERFMQKLEGLSDPEMKCKAIGNEFISFFEVEALKIGQGSGRFPSSRDALPGYCGKWDGNSGND